MSEQLVVRWPGLTGLYDFTVHPLDASWNDVPGIYIFAHEIARGSWMADYIGHCLSFRNRIGPNHHKYWAACASGATHVHAMVHQGGEAARQMVEADLLAFIKTPCNEVMNSR